MFLHNLPKERIKDYLDLAYTLISADGVLTEKEMENFSMYAIELHIDKIPECSIVEYETVLERFENLDGVIQREIYFELLSLAYIDTKYDNKEKELLKKVQEKFKITDSTVEKIENIVVSIMDEYTKLGAIIHE